MLRNVIVNRALALVAVSVAALVLALDATAAAPPGHRIGHAGAAQGDSAFASASASIRRPKRLWVHVEGRIEDVLGGVICYLGGYTSKKAIFKFASGLYELPVPKDAARCDLFADANGSGRVSIEFRAVTVDGRR